MNPDFEPLIVELSELPDETEWVEFKHNNFDPEEIGEYISALANSATLVGKSRAYIVWGIEDVSHEIVGTVFRPSECKVGNEDLEAWLARLLSPRIHFRFTECEARGRRVVLLEIPAASHTPVRFKTDEYVRIGSYKKRLREHPEKERILWALFERNAFEEGLALENVSGRGRSEPYRLPGLLFSAGIANPYRFQRNSRPVAPRAIRGHGFRRSSTHHEFGRVGLRA